MEIEGPLILINHLIWFLLLELVQIQGPHFNVWRNMNWLRYLFRIARPTDHLLELANGRGHL